MDRTHWEEIIERVERELAESERQIALQRKIVDDLELLGQPTGWHYGCLPPCNASGTQMQGTVTSL